MDKSKNVIGIGICRKQQHGTASTVTLFHLLLGWFDVTLSDISAI